MNRLPAILRGVILVLSFGLNARMAANPRSAYQSADERAYGKLAIDIADKHDYSSGMQEPLHWPPGAPVLFAIDEMPTVGLPNLPGYLATVGGSGITMLLYAQALPQIEDVYGP